MVVLKYREWLTVMPSEVYWVYDVCEEMPEWDVVKQKYTFRKRPRRVTPQMARDVIKEHGLSCVCNNEYGRIYA